MPGLLDKETGHEVWRYARVCGTVGPAARKNMKSAHGIQQFSKTGKGDWQRLSRQSESPSAPSPIGRII